MARYNGLFFHFSLQNIHNLTNGEFSRPNRLVNAIRLKWQVQVFLRTDQE